ncbi:MAG: dihydroxyacetone kinase phosphoryl donor subunit DhaM [Microbacteriaceae bacterium]|nr:dihydroxyacetone kinase phosphoryl donor subunit DhaM [Microbacteriaceae bacterium]
MIGIVVVSHSPALARAAVELAAQMAGDSGLAVEVAAGGPDGGLGTDATAVASAIDAVATPEGVLVFVDLGSAILSADLALELRMSDAPVRVTSAPLVEGLVAAVVAAAGGAALEVVAAEAERALAPKREQLDGGAEAAAAAPVVEVAPARMAATVVIANAAGIHARPAAALAAASAGFDATVSLRNLRTGAVVEDAASMSSVLLLGARFRDEIEIGATGAQAQAAVRHVEELITAGFGEEIVAAPAIEGPVDTPIVEPQPAAAPAAPPVFAPHLELFAPGDLALSPGSAVGPVVRMPEPGREPRADRVIATARREAAAATLAPAFAAVRASLEARVRRLGDARYTAAREVLEATAALAADAALITDAQMAVFTKGRTPERAVWDALGAFADRLAEGDLAERAADVRDLRARVVAQLRGRPAPGVPDLDTPFVLVARELAPADAALLGTTGCVALVTAAGGPTSHTAILARALGVPAVVSERALEVAEGQTVLVDGTAGEVVVEPDAERVAQASARPLAPPFDGAGTTADGHSVRLRANVASGAEAVEAAAARAEGVGLFRTELVFLDRQLAPALDEQIAAYRPVLEAFPGRVVVVRTLDAGADKPLAFVPRGAESNPALGVRGIRTARTAPALLDEQLRAIAMAAGDARAEVHVMAPMISTPTEARAFAAAARAHGLGQNDPARPGFGKVGVMIETPAAALCAAELLAELDFVSVGTNDLAQYALAADRELATLAELNDPWQPAVLRLIGMVGAAGVAAGKPVGICGEAAADPSLAPVLVGLGATSLSVSPRALDAVAAGLRAVTHAQCVAAADAAAGASSALAARAAAREVLAG